MRTIDADAALKALRKCQTYLYDARDPELKIELSSAEAAIKELPIIQPQSTTGQLNDGARSTAQSTNLIDRQATIDAAKDWYEGLICGSINGLIKRLNALPTIQPEPAIPLSWIENEIEWLKSLDSTFSEITAIQISAMVKKWRDEQDETD